MALLGACSAPVAASDPRSVAREAYIFGAPLVTTVRTLQSLAPLSPVNRLTWQPTLAGPQSRTTVTPNRDTIYVGAPMDLRVGPFVLTVPAISDRYYSFQFLDAYTEDVAYVGTRVNGGAAGTYLIAPSTYTGATPDGMTRVGIPTLQFFLVGRFAVNSAADVPTALRYQDQVRLISLAEYQGRAAPAAPELGAPAGPPQDLAQSGLRFFDELGAAMAVNIPYTKVSKRVARRMAKVGIGPGMTPSAITDEHKRRELEAGLAEGEQAVARAAANAGVVTDGWQSNRQVGTYGDDYLLRAVISRIGWGANLPAEVMYALTRADSTQQPLIGSNRYTVTFSANALPPTRAFWSISAYGPELYFVQNPFDRYSISSLEPLAPNADGTVTITFSSSRVSATNWVPVPDGEFVLVFRNYWPTSGALESGYHPPALVRV
ncbi:MAG: DUF1254 domain-containing protein [Acidimicrobiia bacterium]